MLIVNDPGDAAAPPAGRLTLRAALTQAAQSPAAEAIRFDPAVFSAGAPAIANSGEPWPTLGGGDRLDGMGSAVRLGAALSLGSGGAGVFSVGFENAAGPSLRLVGPGTHRIETIDVQGGGGGVLVTVEAATDDSRLLLNGLNVLRSGGPALDLNAPLRAEVRGLTARENGGPGIRLFGAAPVSISDCTVEVNASHGLEVAPPLPLDPSCAEGFFGGIGPAEQRLEVRNCRFAQNGGFGIWLNSGDVNAQIQDTVLEGNGQDGLRVEARSRARVAGGRSASNAGNGLSGFNGALALDLGSPPEVTGNGGAAVNLGQNFCNWPVPAAPEITELSMAPVRVAGRAEPGALVAVFADPAEELGSWLGTVVADANGAFLWSRDAALPTGRINAVAQTEAGPPERELSFVGPVGSAP